MIESIKGNLSATLPLYAKSSPNAREHWAARSRRTRAHRTMVALFLKPSRSFLERVKTVTAAEPLTVLLTRVRPARRQALDDDNLKGALKAVRDGVADVLGIDDGSDRIRFSYAQAVGRDYAVRIDVTVGKAGA